MMNTSIFAFLNCGSKISNLKNIFKNTLSLFSRFKSVTYEISYCVSKKDVFFEFLTNQGYIYSYLDENDIEYATYLENDSEVYWGYRSNPIREVVTKSLKDEISITEIFGSSTPCLNMNLPYVEYQNIRINLGHESKRNLFELLEQFGIDDALCKLYYHATLSYAFHRNELVNVSEIEKDDDYSWNKVYTYVADIPIIMDFVDQYYDRIIDDSSVFRVGNIVFGFYDSGLNILSLDNDGLLHIVERLDSLGYIWNEIGFYEKILYPK